MTGPISNRFRMPQFLRPAADFPGRMRGSRTATRLFQTRPLAWRYVSREDLEKGFMIALTTETLSLEQKDAIRQFLLDKKLLNLETRRNIQKQNKFPLTLWHYDFRKMITHDEFSLQCEELNKIAEQNIFVVQGRQFKVIPVKTVLPRPACEKPIEETLKKILGSSVIAPAQAYILLAERVKVCEAEFEALKGLLCANHTMSITSDGYMYLSADEKMHIDAGLLVPVKGQEQLRSNKNLETELLSGAIVRVFYNSGQMYYLPEAYKAAAKIERYVEYLTPFGDAWINEKDMDYVEAAEKVLVGRTADGAMVAIKNTPSLRAKHADLLYNYEIFHLRKMLSKMPEDKVCEMLDRLAAAAKETKQPLYLLIYQARKMMQTGMLLSDTIYYLKPMKDDRRQNDVSAYPFRLLNGQKWQVENTIDMQRKVAGGIDRVALFLAERLARAVYRPEALNPDDWEELRFLCYSVAAQNGYDRIAAKCKDLYYMYNLPDIYLQGVDHFVEKTELSRRQAESWLEEGAVPYIKAALMRKLGLREDELWVFFPPKTYASTGRKVGKRERNPRSKEITTDMLRARVVIRCHSMTDQGGEERSQHLLRQAVPLLKQMLAPLREFDDFTERPRASGWQGLQVHGNVNGKPFELLVQTEAMYRREKKADAKQMHWARDVNIDAPETQLFDEIPPLVAQRLTLLPGHDFNVLREKDENYLHVMLGTEKDKPGLLPIKGDIIPAEQVANMDFYTKKASINIEKQEKKVPTAWDFFSGSKQVSAPFSELHSYGIYRFERDAQGRSILVRKQYAQGEPKTLKDGDVMLFFRRPQKERARNDFKYITLLTKVMEEAVLPVVRYRAFCELEAAINAKSSQPERERKKKERITKVSEGKEIFRTVLEEVKKGSSDSKTFFAANETELVQNIARILNFKSNEDFLHALALEYVSREMLRICLDHMGYQYTVMPYTGNFTLVSFTLPDQKGILRRLYQMGVLQGKLRSLRTSPYVSFKLNRVEVTFGLINEAGFNTKKLEAALNSLLCEARFTSTATRERPFEKLLTYTVTVIPPAGNSWDNLQDIVGFIDGIKGMNIYKVELMPINGERERGTIKLEIPFELIENPEQKAHIFRELAKLGALINEDQ